MSIISFDKPFTTSAEAASSFKLVESTKEIFEKAFCEKDLF